MKFVICLAFLAFAAAVVSGQDAETGQVQCDEDFITAYKTATAKCFKPEEKEVAKALLGQPAPTSVRKILRRRRSDDDKGLKKEWINDPEKLKQMSEKIECVEKEVAHTDIYKNIETECEEKLAEITDEKVDKQHAKWHCMGTKLAQVCKGKLHAGGHEGKDGNQKARPE